MIKLINQIENQPQNNKSNKKIILIILAIAIIGVVFYFGKDYIFKSDNSNNNNNQQNTNPPNNNNQQTPDNGLVVPSSDAFLFAIEDVFTITGRGTVVTGQVARGSIKVGDEVEIVGLGEKKTTVVTGIEMFREMKDEAVTGDNAGLILQGIGKDEVQRGQVVAKVNSIGLHTKFKANIFVLTKAEGGKSELVFEGTNIQFYVRTTDISGKINSLKKIEPKLNFEGAYTGEGDTFEISVDLVTALALEKGTQFSMREGGRTVGGGIITEIIN